MRLARRGNTARAHVLRERVDQVAEALGRTDLLVGHAGDSLTAALARVVTPTDRHEVWLALAVVSGALPTDAVVTEACRRAEFDGIDPLVEAIEAGATPLTLSHRVRVVTDATVVDVHNTARTQLATGIQRVARETASRWAGMLPCTMVAWTDGFSSLRDLSPAERARMDGTAFDGSAVAVADEGASDIVVPWRSTYLVPELVADRPRNQRILALARWSQNRTGVIGFDCIPLTSGDTSDAGVPDFFADHLATVRHVDRITTISRAAATEYRGWRTMLQAIGLAGPEIEPQILPAEAPVVGDDALDRARRRFVVAGMPLVLCVGTHEPRKNHGAVLHAAQVLWREGLQFSLTFVGGHSWRGSAFLRDLEHAQRQGLPVESVSGVGDDLLWPAYRLARCTVFPSFNEGYGLPVAESLAAGTPAITSGYGSMAEIAAGGGVLVVDPRDDQSVIDALRTMLTDEDRYGALRAEAAQRPVRTWDDYAAETLAYLTGQGVAAATTGDVTPVLPSEPRKPASPKVNTPPSEANIQ